MKSFLFWIGGLIVGALAGYGIAIYFGFSPVLSIGCGIIMGSTAAITYNILRDDEDEDDGENNLPEPLAGERGD